MIQDLSPLKNTKN